MTESTYRGLTTKKRPSAMIKITILLIALLSFLSMSMRTTEATTFIVQDGLIKIGNPYYEIAFSTVDGGIAYILDKSTNQNISNGDLDGNLWFATPDKGDGVSGNSYSGHFSYSWDASNSSLALTYTGALTVIVTVNASDSQWLKMQATVTNNAGANIRLFGFPRDLKIAGSYVTDAMLPLMPGAVLNSTFFSKSVSFINEYPGVMFADYLAVHSAKGKMALYSQKGTYLQPILLGFEHIDGAANEAKITHNYKTWIMTTKSWSTPWVVIHVGQDYPDTILSYRMDNGIDNFRSLTAKLGSAAQTYFSSPMYKLDLVVLRQTFKNLKTAVVDNLNIPGMVHFVAFQPGGQDKHFPDFIPPDPKWGTTADFANLVSVIKSKGGLAVPYTNFSWWNPDSPTLTNLPPDTTLDSIVVKDADGLSGFETYGAHSGYVINLQSDFVKSKFTEQHNALTKTIGADGIFEDQWGTRNAPVDFNSAALKTYDPATAYFQGVLDHYSAYANDNLMTEVGVDMLAKDGVGFMGTNYLWDILGYRGSTASYTTYYPMAGMLLRDKVLLYQHNLAAQTWTKNKDMLRWNLAQGYNLSNAFYDETLPGLNMNNPWLNLIGVFQKYALSNYANQLVMGYDDLGNNVKKTVFSTYQVYSNWDANRLYTVNGNTLPPGGVVTQAKDGSVTAGVFTSYNDNALSTGEHYIVEVRSASNVKVFQPVGPDTTIHLRIPVGTNPIVTAYKYNGTAVTTVNATVSGNDFSFTYQGNLEGQTVGYYQISGLNVVTP